ncbi:MFS transporter [Flammeovirga pectinis]|uniref:MFS transporter n=1 Tax=Flammeovirga pectinis TaxID=2494373 RepID=A0A3S9P2I9_9BACT|nr:MFS transporter [Flammeovirga pectinis]AZQ62375.1 MFS transporter [Flammeovirga pectinis]
MNETIENSVVKDTQTKQKNHTGPFLIMVGLMFVVGFLTVVNQQFQAPLQEAFLSKSGDLKNTLATFITFAFFMGYPSMGNIASKWVDNSGHKTTLIRGLIMLIAALGIEVLSAQFAGLPSVTLMGGEVPQAFFIFLLGSYVLGCSMAVLQTVINPFIAVCEVPGTSSVTRLSIAGTINSIGTTVAPFFVAGIIFGGAAPQVAQILLPLSILMIVVAVVAGVLKNIELPNPMASDSGEEIDPATLTKSIWSFKHLALGVVAIFVYVGAEVAVGSNIVMHAKQIGIDKETYALMATLYWGSMLVGRLCGSFLSKIPGHTQLLVTSAVALVLVLAAMFTQQLWLLVGVGLMHSIMWGAIFSLAIDKLGPYTSKGSGALMIGVAGGAILPWVQGVTADAIGGWDMTWIIVALCEAFLLFYAVSGYKHDLD